MLLLFIIENLLRCNYFCAVFQRFCILCYLCFRH